MNKAKYNLLYHWLTFCILCDLNVDKKAKIAFAATKMFLKDEAKHSIQWKMPQRKHFF